MKIENDTIIFETADFDALTDFSKKALSAYLGDYAAYFSARANKDIDIAKAHLKTLSAADPVTDSILSGLAKADEATLFAVAPLLAKIDSVLNP